MFDNIGKKIKVLAEVFCILGICCSIIIGIYLFSYPSFKSTIISNNQQDSTDIIYIIYGFIIIVLGSLSSWISSFCLYGFGELIERVSSIDGKLSIIKKQNRNSNITKESDIDSLLDNAVFCLKCGADVTDDQTNCHVCGEKIKNTNPSANILKM